jgi:hypothetical protein
MILNVIALTQKQFIKLSFKRYNHRRFEHGFKLAPPRHLCTVTACAARSAARASVNMVTVSSSLLFASNICTFSASAAVQGLTLVHFSAQQEPCTFQLNLSRA